MHHVVKIAAGIAVAFGCWMVGTAVGNFFFPGEGIALICSALGMFFGIGLSFKVVGV